MLLAHTNIPLKGHKMICESGKLHSKPFPYFFSLGALVFQEGVVKMNLFPGLELAAQAKFRYIFAEL